MRAAIVAVVLVLWLAAAAALVVAAPSAIARPVAAADTARADRPAPGRRTARWRGAGGRRLAHRLRGDYPLVAVVAPTPATGPAPDSGPLVPVVCQRFYPAP